MSAAGCATTTAPTSSSWACAGMARYRDELEEAVQIPVVEPTQAAVTMAIGRVRLGWGKSLVR